MVFESYRLVEKVGWQFLCFSRFVATLVQPNASYRSFLGGNLIILYRAI